MHITITLQSANKLRVNQRAMERAMLGVSLRDHIIDEILRQTQVIIVKIFSIKWSWA